MERFPILYTFRRCPYAMRARMAMTVSGVAFAWREVLLRDKPEAMVEASPKATVPVLVLPDGSVIDESIDVMLWALSESDPEGWLPDDPIARKDAYALIERNDGPFKRHLDRYKYATRYEDADPEADRAAGYAILEDLNTRLERTAYLSGDRLGLTDIAIFPFIRQFRIADPGWFDATPLARLKSWLMARMESELFSTIMVKQKPWVPGDLEWVCGR